MLHLYEVGESKVLPATWAQGGTDVLRHTLADAVRPQIQG